MKRATVRLALLHVRESERLPLISAVNSIHIAGLLSAALEWVRVDEADLLIADIDQPETEPTLRALQADRPRVRLRYASQRGGDAEITRPLRVQSLTDALQRAVEEVLQGATARAAPSSPADDGPAAPSTGRVYRGQRH